MNEYKKEKQIDDKTKALIQVRKSTGSNILHLQVYGENLDNNNREYGYADKFTVPMCVTDAVKQFGNGLNEGEIYPSLATPSPVYIREIATVHAFSDGVQLHIKVSPTLEHEWNSPNGFIMDLPPQRFAPMIAFLEDNDLLITHEGTRYIGGEEE